MANPNLRDGANRKWKEFSRYKHGVVQGNAQLQAIAEDERRRPDDTEPPAAAKPIFANKAPSPSGPVPDNQTPLDRFHKFGRVYVTVSPIHFGGDDPIPDPAAFHTIAEGYAFAKTLAAKSTNDDERIELDVFGGTYTEDLLIDDSKIDLVGIGKPTILGRWVVEQHVTKVLIDNFRIINPDTEEDELPRDNAGLYVSAGYTQLGTHISNIQVRHCHFQGPNMQVHIRRWVDFEDCDFISDDNLSTGIPSVQCLWMVEGDLISGITAFQTKWSQFRGCRFYGAKVDPAVGANPLLVPNYFQKGYALEISVIDADTGQWKPNVWTSFSGVFLKDCLISGFTTNYGWNLRHDNCSHIEGYIVVSTAGSVHHLAFCNSDDDIVPSTWFNHSTFTVRYLVCIIDVTIGGGGTCNIYLRSISRYGADHSQPPVVMPVGADVIDGGNLVPIQPKPAGTIYAANYSTPALFVYSPGGVEAAVISNVTVAANNLIFTEFWEDL